MSTEHEDDLVERVATLERFLGLRRVGRGGFEETTTEPVAPLLRTRRLAVVNNDGVEQVTCTTQYQGGRVEVSTGGDTADTYRAKAVLAASSDDYPDAGIWLHAAGNITSEFTTHVYDDNRVESYLDLHRDACGHGQLDYVAELRGDGVSMMEHYEKHPVECSQCKRNEAYAKELRAQQAT